MKSPRLIKQYVFFIGGMYFGMACRHQPQMKNGEDVLAIPSWHSIQKYEFIEPLSDVDECVLEVRLVNLSGAKLQIATVQEGRMLYTERLSVYLEGDESYGMIIDDLIEDYMDVGSRDMVSLILRIMPCSDTIGIDSIYLDTRIRFSDRDSILTIPLRF